MRLDDICIATITLARTPREERVLRRSLEALVGLGKPLFVADGGSTERFQSFLLDNLPRVASPKKRGLVIQVKTALKIALTFSDRPFILYTEPDKLTFFQSGLQQFVANSKRGALSFAARDERSLRTFPAGQQNSERFMNESVETITRLSGDFCYGPLLLSRETAKLALDAPEDLGWGWRFWLLGRIVRLRQRVRVVTGPFRCPPEQRAEDTTADRIYRLKQLRQNLDGLFLGLEL